MGLFDIFKKKDKSIKILTTVTMEQFNSKSFKKLGFKNKKILIGRCIDKDEELMCLINPDYIINNKINYDDIYYIVDTSGNNKFKLIITKDVEGIDYNHYLAVVGLLTFN